MNQPCPSPRLQPTLANRLKWIRYFIKFSVRYGHWDFFSDFNIEINTSCNRRCAYCPNSVFERGLIKNEQRMDEALYHKLIDERPPSTSGDGSAPSCTANRCSTPDSSR